MQGKRRHRRQMNFGRLIELIPGRHHHQDIHVAVSMHPASGMRAEQNDFVRVELLSYIPRKLLDDFSWNTLPAIPTLARCAGCCLSHNFPFTLQSILTGGNSTLALFSQLRLPPQNMMVMLRKPVGFVAHVL
jgi:hypothetical protein